MSIELTVPTVGESISEVFIGEWLKLVGDAVVKDEPLVEIETDKATLEIPSPVNGVLKNTLKQGGESANVGEIIAYIEEGAAITNSLPKQEISPPQNTSSFIKEKTDFAMPSAERLATQKAVDLAAVQATGPGERLLKEDVQRHLEAAAEAPTVLSEGPLLGERPEEAVPMSPLRRTVAKRLVKSQQTTATLTTFNEIDMSVVKNLRSDYKEAFEKSYGVRLGFMSFFVRAAVEALKTIPQINARIENDNIIYHNYYDIGIAVSGKKGLLVPIIRYAERLSFAEIEKTINDFAKRAQTNKITPDELTGGTFTISNGGVFGSLLSTPILNPPQSGVLGMHNIVERPIAIKGQVTIRPIMYVALSYDHRIVDGREAVTFLKKIKDNIENPTRLLLEI